ncbi:MAG: hypothetical protein IH586_00675, partial [Anaerolineaceae bacterium]|nr:hypothetical protein [Anaerolineaceae bacterium]
MSSLGSVQKSFRFRLHPGERRIILATGDIVMAILALLISIYMWGQKDWLDFSKALLIDRIPPWFFSLPVIWILLNVEMYDIRRAGRRSETIKGILVSAGVSLILYMFVFFLSEPNSLPRRGVAAFIVASSLLMLIWRFVYIQVFTAQDFMRRVLIVGAGRAGSTLIHVIRESWPPPFFLVGLIDDDVEKIGCTIEGAPILGSSSDLSRIIDEMKVTDLIFAITGEMCDDMFRAIMQAEEDGIEVTTMPIYYEYLLGRVPIFLMRSDWILRSFVDEARAGGLYE